ncbi:tRNA-binding protein [Halotalea alkalilenta]|uniref:tRNA-binding protein n=1 Tax=Halotalea alkalilenta TaxID=376489 RepID=UPI00316AC398
MAEKDMEASCRVSGTDTLSTMRELIPGPMPDVTARLRLMLASGRRQQHFPEARKPAYKLLVDFGPEIGQRKSSAQITQLYTPDALVGELVVAVVNFPPKQIGPVMSECLVTGFHSEQGEVVLCVPDQSVPLGTRLL